MKRVILSLLALVPMLTLANTPEWLDPEVNQINRAPMHANYFAYESKEAAETGCKFSSEKYLNLNGDWKFHWVKNADEKPTEFYAKSFDDSEWDTFQVPGLWELHGYGNPIYVNNKYAFDKDFERQPPLVPTKNNNVGSYRREITIPSNWRGKDVIAHFGSVTSNMYLWVNGKFVGYSEDSKLEAEFDLTKYVKPGKNLIAFQVYRWCDGTYLEDQDFFRFSGVARDCYLYARETKRLEDIRITPDLDSKYEDGSLDIELSVIGTADVKLELLDASGKCIAEQVVGGKESKRKARIEVQNPLKWTAETPKLYTLQATCNG